MKKTATGHDEDQNGRVQPLKEYVKGETYEVSDSLGKCFLNLEVGEVEKERVKRVEKASSNRKTKESTLTIENKKG